MATKATPFSLVYGAESVVPPEILVPSARMSLEAGLFHEEVKQLELESLEE
ncbi:hypothetical protein COLO4_21776 [Corchorus olitorius]|uniref:Uncharacterized protein n=1 Tax=Corchorus olitorius TaxID=93759 RepID=A0A1R3IR97_9ROSI|nr:hypothetical protein COLO4_21776 [Corchorus olitorius]